MAVRFYQSSQFEEVRSRIEHHLYDSILELDRFSAHRIITFDSED